MWSVVAPPTSAVALLDDLLVVVALTAAGYLMLLHLFNTGSFRHVGIGGVGGALEVRVWEGHGVFVVCSECGH